MTIPSDFRAPSNGRACFSIAGEPAGRRVVLVHGDSAEARSWEGFLRAVPAGQEWVSVVCAQAGDGVSGLRTAALGSLLAVRRVRRVRKTLLIGCGAGAPDALRAALDGPERVGGLLLIDPVADAECPGMFRRIAARLRPPAANRAADGADGDVADGLRELAPLLATIRMPVMVLQGRSDPARPNATPTLERALTGCRTLTVVTVPAARVLPSRHDGALRGALAALAAAVERGGP